MIFVATGIGSLTLRRGGAYFRLFRPQEATPSNWYSLVSLALRLRSGECRERLRISADVASRVFPPADN